MMKMLLVLCNLTKGIQCMSAYLLRRSIAAVLLTTVLLPYAPIAQADLRSPAWYNNNTGAASDWHYRIPITIPADAPVHATVKFDVDFSMQLKKLGISGIFDINSPRVVKADGKLVNIQQYTDTVYNGVTDPVDNNNKGEVRFILEDAGSADANNPTIYYLYFDITENGNKPSNPQTPINGNFEFGAVGTQSPPGWTVTKNPRYTDSDAQIVAGGNISITNPGWGGATASTNSNPYTGLSSYLIGYRTNNEPTGFEKRTTFIQKNVDFPIYNAGSFSFFLKSQGFSYSIFGDPFDYLKIELMDTSNNNLYLIRGRANRENPMLSYAACPNSLDGRNEVYQDKGWRQCSFIIPSALQGKNVDIKITAIHTWSNKSWFLLDNIEWSVFTGILDTPEAFGVNISQPASGTTLTAGQNLTICAQLDAKPTAANQPVTVNIYDANDLNTVLASNIILYNDGSHGDGTANDNVWCNNGLDTNNPTYTTNTTNSKLLIRVYAKDASTNTANSSNNGLVRIPIPGQGTPATQSNYYNIDEQIYTVNIPQITNQKTATVISDPINNTSNPRYISGAVVEYTIRITNNSNLALGSPIVIDGIPNNTTLYTGAASGNAPFTFTDGTPSSGLSCTTNNNCIEYSNNNKMGWNYTPTVDYDSNITHIRFKPTGTMAAKTATGNAPYFELKFRVKIN